MIGHIQYGDCVLDLTQILPVRRDVTLSDDGVDYLYTQTTIDVICTLNPSATSFSRFGGAGGLVPQAGGEAWAGRTDRILHDYLSQPRRKLTMWTYDKGGKKVIYLQSPVDALPSDAKNGPVCKVFSIQEVHGPKTWMMHLQFITWVNNCYDKNSPIISHRWMRNVDTDEQHRAIVTTQGVVVFNVGRLWAQNQSPDFYRREFFQAPSENFAREHVNVNIGSDGTTATYTVVDVERFVNLGGGSAATKVEATLTNWHTQGSIVQAVADTGGQISTFLMSAAGNSFNPLNYAMPFIGLYNAFNLLGQGKDTISALAGNIVQQLPKYYANIKIRAIGARDSPRRNLFELCIAIAYARLGVPTMWSLANRSEFIVSQSIHDTVVDVDFTLRWMDQTVVQLFGILGPLGALGPLAKNAFGSDEKALTFLRNYFPLPSGTNKYGNNTYVKKDDKTDNYARPLLDDNMGTHNNRLRINRPMNMNTQNGDTHSRGIGYIKKMMTQGLHGQCEVPAMPGPDEVLPASENWDKLATDTTVHTVDNPVLKQV